MRESIKLVIVALLLLATLNCANPASASLSAETSTQLAQVESRQEKTWVVPETSEVVVEFKSVPPNAKVEIDGKLICETPCSRALRAGHYKIVIKQDGFLPWEKEVDVKDGIEPLIALLVKNAGWLTIRTSTPGLKVLIDKKPVGNTPIEGLEVAPGAHEVAIEDERAYPASAQVTIEAGESKIVELAPAVRVGVLYVRAVDGKNNALQADIYVDGKQTGKAYQAIPLIIGRHKVRAKYQDLASWEEEVTIEEGKSLTFEMRLDLAKEILNKGVLFVETSDKNGNKLAAKIYVDGKLKGESYQKIFLSAGDHKIKAKYKNLSWKGEVNIEGERILTIPVQLSPSKLVKWVIAIAIIAVAAIALLFLARVVIKILREREFKIAAEAAEEEPEEGKVLEKAAVEAPLPVVGPDEVSIEVSGPSPMLDIFVNNVNTAKKTPCQIVVNRGDFIYVEKIDNGAWVVQCDERYISFKRKEFAEGYRIFADIGDGDILIGYSFDKSITQKSFDELINAAKSLRVLLAVDCKNVSSIEALVGKKELWVLNLSGTQVSKISALADMSSLIVLYLDGTPVSDISALGNLKELRILSLKGAPVSDVTALSGFSKLESLDLGATQISKISAIASLKGLKKLYLRNAQITDVIALANMSKLEHLDLGGTKVVNLAPLMGLSKLRWLGLVGTPVSNLAPLVHLKELEWLGLGRTKVSDISHLASLTKLRVLLLGGTSVSDITPLGLLKDLEWLDLGGTRVSDISAIANLKELKTLYLGGTQVAKESVDQLQALLPNCKIDYF